MRAWGFACLLSFGVVTGLAGTELHVSKVGEAPDFVDCASRAGFRRSGWKPSPTT